MTDKTSFANGAEVRPEATAGQKRMGRFPVRPQSHGSETSCASGSGLSSSAFCKVFLLAAALSAASVLPSRAATPTVREYGTGGRSTTQPAVRELTPPKLPPSGGLLPFSLSLFPAAEFPPCDWDVVFLRINLLVGRHRNMYGFDFGSIGNETTGEFVGIQSAGFYNKVGWSEGALQFAGIMNRSERDFVGLQSALVNITDGTMAGFQLGLVNRAARLDGLQIGLFNIAETGSGVQIGLWNSAQSLEGLQIGLANCNSDSTMPFFPVINFAF